MGAAWEGWFTVAVVVLAFGCLLWDLIQPDHVMIGALALLMASGVVTVEEGLAGFANEGLLTVATLFVVAAGISATGGLDWYMGKLLGRPRTIAGAQLRLMLPIALVSGFLNNTPVVAVMIPIVQRWAENIHIPKEQVMIPLSFASILGGTCTLIGTSTNLVVLGMLRNWRGSNGEGAEGKTNMGLFDLGLYGVPCVFTGMTYILLASRALLPGGKAAARRANHGDGDGGGRKGAEDLIVGARLQPWSAACGKTVAGSGLRGLPGLYLVSVKRDDALMRAVGPEFVLAQGDVLYFTGMVESLGRVCAEHGLEAVSDEHDSDSDDQGLDDDDEIEVGYVSDGTGADGSDAGYGSSDADAPRVDVARRRDNAGVDVPASVPEMSELMEIQMMARSQAIGGVISPANANANGTARRKSDNGKSENGSGVVRRRVSRTSTDADPSASGGESDAGATSDGSGALRRASRSPTRRRRRSANSNVAAEDAESLLASAVAVDPGERRSLKIYRRGRERSRRATAKAREDHEAASRAAAKALGPPKVTVETDPEANPNDPAQRGRMVLGVSATDRPGLLHDISQGLNRLRVQLLHCEASAVANRSVSIWRLQAIEEGTTRDEIVTVIQALLSPTTGVEATKRKGEAVLRVRVREESRLVGKTPAEVNFRVAYGATIIAAQRGGRRPEGKLGQIRLAEGDSLVLQLVEDSPLLSPPPEKGARDAADVAEGAEGANAGGMKSPTGRARGSILKLSSSMGDMLSMGRGGILGGGGSGGGGGGGSGDASAAASSSAAAGCPPPASADDVSVAIPNISGYVDPETAETGDRGDTVREALAVSVRDAHRDLEIVGAGTGAGSDGVGKEFLIAVRVERRSQFIKKTADDAGLRALPGLYLVSIERPRAEAGDSEGSGVVTATGVRETAFAPVAGTVATAADPSAAAPVPTEVLTASASETSLAASVVDPTDDPLRAGDVLWFAGNASSIASVRKIPGLAPYSSDQVEKLNVNNQERRLIQAVVAKTGPLVGKSIRDIKFRSRYNAVVLAVHREGQRVHARVGDVVLHPGDVLLLDAGPDFHREAGHSGSGFALVSVLEDSAPPRLRLLVPVLLIAVAMIAVYTSGWVELIVAAVFAAAIMIACGALSEQEARDAVKWDVIVTIAAAFGMSRALQNSGVAGTVAATLVRVAEISSTGRVGLLVAVYLATFLISNVVTNNAAAALMFPIAAEAAERQGETLVGISFLVMLAASASFMSPFGYQTNLMVYGPGGYVFKDFLRFGVPMQVVQLVVSVAVIALGERLWWVSWGATAAIFAAVAFVMMQPGGNVASAARRACAREWRRGRDEGDDGEER